MYRLESKIGALHCATRMCTKFFNTYIGITSIDLVLVYSIFFCTENLCLSRLDSLETSPIETKESS